MKKASVTTLLLCMFLCVTAFAQTENDFQVALTADYSGAVITKYTGQGISALRIPETIQSFPVKEIGNRVFYENSTITSVTFPSTIEKIGDEAFFNCRNLQVVTIPANVAKIEFVKTEKGRYDSAYKSYDPVTNKYYTDNFFNCGKLLFSSLSALKQRGYIFANDSKKVGNYTFKLTNDGKGLILLKAEFNVVYALTDQRQHFYEMATVPDVVIPTSIEGMVVKEIGSSSFEYSRYFNSEGHVRTTSSDRTTVPYITNSITIPEEVVYIGEKAFSSNSLRSVVLSPNSKLGRIDTSAFSYCKQLGSITLPSNLRIIGNRAFYYCEKLSSVIIPEGVTEIGSEAFSGCESLTSIVLPNSIKIIGDEAFYRTGLTTITIPDTVEKIGKSAFKYTKFTLPIQAELRRRGYTGDF